MRDFGRPTSEIAASWLSAANFLSYSSNLKLVRVVGAAARNAVSSGAALLIRNMNDWENNFAAGQANVGPFAAKFPGTLGNSLQVSMVDSASWIRTLTGTLTTSVSSANVTGNGTSFTTETHVGATLLSGSTVVGVVKSIASDTVLTLEANATIAIADTGPVRSRWVHSGLFEAAPGTSEQARRGGSANDELHVVVVDTNGAWSGTPGTVLEKFGFLSKASDARTEQGASNFFREVLRGSKYICWMDHPATTGDWGTSLVNNPFDTLADVVHVKLSGGVDANTPTVGELTAGYDLLSDPDQVDVSLIFAGPHPTTIGRLVVQIAESRKDAIGFVSPALASVYNNVGAEEASVIADRGTLNVNSSYGFMDSGWKQQYDRYNDQLRWVPLNADIAGLTARTEMTHDAWWSPAGYNRGVIKNVVKLAWSPNKTSRDALYRVGVNPVVNFPGEGTILWGDKTLLTRPSAFGFINVRRLFIVLEKAIATAAKYSMFEFNDAFTRAQLRNMLEPFLRDVKGRRGVVDFMVVCDESNNTGEIMDRGEFVADIYIKPARSINYITLSFVAVRSSVSFEEILGA